MKRASIAELKARLSEYLTSVRRGEEVVVTNRGRPVARLAPIAGQTGADARQRELLRAGLARAGTGSLPPGFFQRRRPADPEGRSLHAVLAERTGSW